jgi:hypothetical protein
MTKISGRAVVKITIKPQRRRCKTSVITTPLFLRVLILYCTKQLIRLSTQCLARGIAHSDSALVVIHALGIRSGCSYGTI